MDGPFLVNSLYIFQICTSAGWAETFMAIANDEDCEPANDELGLPGDCGKYYPGVVYIIIYLVFSFLVIVNMYIAVILENYTQVCMYITFLFF